MLSSDRLALRLDAALAKGGPFIDDAYNLTVRDVLNAAWMVLLREDQGYAEVLDDVVKKLALRVVDERRSPDRGQGRHGAGLAVRSRQRDRG
jgi:hypothetical protein